MCCVASPSIARIISPMHRSACAALLPGVTYGTDTQTYRNSHGLYCYRTVSEGLRLFLTEQGCLSAWTSLGTVALNQPGLLTLNTGRSHFTAWGSEEGGKGENWEGCWRSQGHRLGHAPENFRFLIISGRLKGSLVAGECPICWAMGGAEWNDQCCII